MLQNLHHLDLSNNIIYDDRMMPFFENFHSQKLVHLNLKNCGLSYDSLKVLLENKHFSNLRDIDLSSNFEIDKFVLGLAKSQTLNKIRHLSLMNCYIDSSSLLELFSSENFSNVTMLNISYNFMIKDEGVMMLAEKPFCRSLTHLCIAKCGLTIEALKCIADSKYLTNLVDLDVSNNEKINLQLFFELTDNIKLFSMMNRIRCDYCGLNEEEVVQFNDAYKLKLVKGYDPEEIDDRYLLEDDVYKPGEENDVSITEEDM